MFLFLKTELIMCPGLLGSRHTRTGLSLSQHADCLAARVCCLTQPSACAKRARNTSQLSGEEKRNQEDAESLGVVCVWLGTSSPHVWQSHLPAPPQKTNGTGPRHQPCCKLRPKGKRCLCPVSPTHLPGAYSPKWTPFHVPRPDRSCPESAVPPAKCTKAMRGLGDNLETPGCSQDLNVTAAVRAQAQGLLVGTWHKAG